MLIFCFKLFIIYQFIEFRIYSLMKLRKDYFKLLLPYLFGLILMSFLSGVHSYELSLVNNATFPIDADTFYFNNHLIYENSSFFYLIQIYSTSTNTVIQIDQSNQNSVFQIGNLPIDNFHRNVFYLAFNMQDYLGFIYDLQSQSGLMGTLLIIDKSNFTITNVNSLYSSYIAANYLVAQDAILAISTFNSANLIINPQNVNVSVIYGPGLVNNWASFTDTVIIKSVNQNYAIVFSISNQIFQLLQLSTNSVINIINQNFVGVNSVCFIKQTQIVIHQGSTVQFYSLPGLNLLESMSINQSYSSYCYYDDITLAVIFVYGLGSDTVFWAYDLNTSQEINITTVSGYNQIYLLDSLIYLVDVQNPATVSYSFFDYQSCHHSYRYDASTFNCYQCPTACSTCNSTQFCYDCFSGNYFIDDYCCGNSQYYQVSNSVKSCHNCPTGCYNCSDALTCITCKAKNYFIDNYCCGNSQFYVTNVTSKSCRNCPTGCYNCSSLQYCYTCNSKYNLLNNYCCGISQYYLLVNGSKSCKVCPTGCFNCSNPNNCYSCKAKNIFVDNYCCGVSQFYIITNGSKSCQACPIGCYNCSNSSFCYSCTANRTLINNYCCLAGQFYSSTSNSCQVCPSGCGNCLNASHCTTCTGNITIFNFHCCLAAQFFSNTAISCRSCLQGCSTCNSQSSCLTCESGWWLAVDSVCYNSTESMLAGLFGGEEGGANAQAAIRSLSQNGFTSFFNSIPSARGAFQTIFGSYAWYDELYLYQYHQRDYGYHMNITFGSLRIVQRQKWQGMNWLGTNQFFNLFGTSLKDMSNSIDHKSKYSSEHFYSQQQRGQGLFTNSLSFFISVFLFTLALYLLLRFIFYLLHQYRWSIHFRKYSFSPFFLMMLLEGNLLQLIFFACGDVKLSFFLSFNQKISNVLSWIFYFFFTFFVSSIFSLLLSSYGLNAKYFCNNAKFNHILVVYFTIQLVMRNLAQAMIHYFFKESSYYQIQLILLASLQVLLITNSSYFLVKSYFKYKLKIWISISQSIVKIFLIVFLYIRIKYIQIDEVNYKTDIILGYIVAFYMILIYVSLSTCIALLIRDFILSIHNTLKQDEKERLECMKEEKRIQQKKVECERIQKAKSAFWQSEFKYNDKKDCSLFFEKASKPVCKSAHPKMVRIKRG